MCKSFFAADVQLKAFENLNIVAGEEVKSEKHESQKSSLNLANLATGLATLGLVDTGPIYTQEIHNKDNYDTTAKSSTIKAGGSITADTGTTNIVGSNLDASGDVTIKADIGGINVASAQELHNASSLDKKVEVKLTDIFTASADAFTNAHKMDDTKLKINVASATFDESTTSAQSVTNVGSSITSGKNVTLDSSDDIAIKGSDVTAKDTLTLTSTTGNIAITESVDTTNTQSSEKHASAEVNLVVQNEYVEAAVAVDSAVKAAEQLKQTKEDYSNYKREVKKLEASLETLQTQYKEKVPGIDYSDIEDLKEVISNTKEDEKYYLAAITLATADLASKTAAVASQGAAAAASTGTLGFSAGISLEMQGSKTSTDTSVTHSNASNLNASNIAINTDTTADTSVTISGSNLNATDTLNIATHDLNVRSSVDTATMNSDSKQINGSITMSVYGGGASGASLGYGENHATSESETNHNSNLLANTMNINVTNDANFKGATVRADETLNLTVGNNLNVESVRDSSTSASHGMNASLGVSAGGNNTSLSGANASIGSNNSRSSEKQTVLTSLTGDNVNITVGENTNLKGSLIAAGSTDENGVFQDNNNLNLSTKTLTFENSTNTKSSNSQGLGIGAGVNQQGDVSSVSAQVSTGTSYERTKTLATLGTGTITISNKENSDDLARLNTDTTQVDKSLFKTDTGTSASGTLDTRLLTAEGRAQIKEDYEKTKRLGEAAYETATMDSVSIIADQADGQTSFAERLNDKEALAQASKIIASQENTQLLATLTNPNATDEEKTQAYQNIVSALSEQMGISTSEVKLILSNTEKGGYSPATDTTYIATNAQATSGDAANTLAHETSHSADAIRDAGIQTTQDYTTNREEYATLTGDDFQRYLNNAMENNGYDSLNTITDNRYGTTTTSPILQNNTVEFNSLEDALFRMSDPRLNVFYGTKTGISPEEKAGFIQGVKNVNTFSTVGSIGLVRSNPRLAAFFGLTGLITEGMLWSFGDTNFGEITRGQIIDQLPGESPKAKIVKEVTKEVSKQVLPIDKN
jgi:filamentous hemagglutinin